MAIRRSRIFASAPCLFVSGGSRKMFWRALVNGLVESERLAAQPFLKGQNKCSVQYGHPNVQL